MLNTSQLAKDELLTLIQKENFVGWIYSIDFYIDEQIDKEDKFKGSQS